jgi:glycosyltransferase involved in cell wall biosynthesis
MEQPIPSAPHLFCSQKKQARPLRVLHLSSESGFRGGEQQVLNLMLGLQRKNVPQALLVPPGSLLGEKVPSGVDWFALPDQRRRVLMDAFRLREVVVHWRPDVLHAHTSHSHSLVRWAQTLGLVRCPLLVTRRVDFPLKSGWGNRWKYCSPKVRYVAISRAIKTVLRAGGVEPSRIQLVYSGVDPERFGGYRVGVPEPLLGHIAAVAKHVPIWICVAALVDHKDHETLLRAAGQLKRSGRSFCLLLAGEGDCRSRIEEQVRAENLDHEVRLLGRVDGSVLRTLHRAATGFVLTSKLEGLGTAVLDAMAAGVPVVATAAGGVPESVHDGETGWLCPVGDGAAVSRAMTDVMEQPDEARRRARLARELVLAQFTQDSMIAGTYQAYMDCLTA